MARGTLIRVLAATVLAIGAVAAGFAIDAHTRTGVPLPQHEVDASTQCVLPAEEMRRRHMDLLKHQRDRTVHQGIRGEKVDLNSCIACHAGKGAGASAGSAIGSATAFCESCHQYTAVKLDCFQCHQPRPAADASAGANPWPAPLLSKPAEQAPGGRQ